MDTAGKEEMGVRLSMISDAVIICTSVQGSKNERVIQVVTSNGIVGPGEVASPAHSVSESILQALAVTSSRECLP